MKTLVSRGSSVVALFICISCATQLRTMREVPARVSLPGVKTLAILPFTGRSPESGLLLAEKISMELSSAGHFTIVERNLLDRVLSEQALAISGLANDINGAKIGQLTNSDAVITGTISVFQVKNSSHVQKTKQGNIRVYDRMLKITVNAKVILASKGTIVFSEAIPDTQGASHDDPDLLPSAEELFEKSATIIANYLKLQICPHYAALRITLDLGKGALKEALKPGIQFAKNNLSDRALESFRNVSQEFPEAAAPLYNQGVMLLWVGDYSEAERLLNKAIDLYPSSKAQKTTGSSLSAYTETLNEVQTEKRNQSRLLRQKEEIEGGTQEEPELTASVKGDVSWRNRVRIAVVIPEVLLRRQVPDPAGETKIIQTLIDAGFKPIEQVQISHLRYTPEVTAAIENAAAAAILARKLKVDVIIIGEAFGEEAGRASGLQSWRARLEARAIYSDTQEIICALSEYGSGADISNAVAGKKSLENAGTKVGKQLVAKLDDYHMKKRGLTAGTRAARERSQFLRVTAKSANIRMEPNTASPIVGQAKSGEDLILLEEGDGWYFVRTADGTEGWIHASLVRKAGP